MAIAKKKRNVKRGNAGVAAKSAVRNKNLEPIWTGWEQMTGEQFFKHKQSSIRYYYTTFKLADLLANVYGWMKENEYSKEDIRAAKAASSGMITATAAIHARMLANGMPDFNPEEQNYYEEMPGLGDSVAPVTEYIKERVRLAIQNGKINLALKKEEEPEEEEVPAAKPYVPTIQERIAEQAGTMSEDIDQWLESFLDNKKTFDPNGFDFKRHFTAKGVTQAHARKLRRFYDEQLNDFRELEQMPTAGQMKKLTEDEIEQWTQLKEAYSHFSKNDVKKYTSAIVNVIEALDFVIEASKAQRKPRKAKPKSATKLVEKLKYCVTDDKYQTASIAPELIIGAAELWVFNTKTRKLGKYVAEKIDPTGQRADSGLSVKGTTIIGYDPQKSLQKTLRKPSEQLKEFKSAGKVALRKFLEDITTTETLLNGRLNDTTVLLKVN